MKNFRNSCFYVTAALLLATGCSEESKIVSVVEDETPIAFATFADKATKVAPTSLELEYYHQTMAVYGTKKDSESAIQKVFDKVTVTADTVGKTVNEWSYSPLRYWDKQASYEFIAFAPADAPIEFTIADDSQSKPTAINTAGNKFQTTGSSYVLVGQNLQQDSPSDSEILKGFTGVTGDVDIMLSDDTIEHAGSAKGTISFNFKHILSKMNVTVSAVSVPANAEICVKSIEVTGLKDEGKYSGTSWTASQKASDYKLSYSSSTGIALSTLPTYFIESLVMPQKDETDRKIGSVKMIYTIKTTDGGSQSVTETFTYNVDLKDVFPATITGYSSGYSYTVNFKIDVEDTSILFDATVTSWNEESVTYPEQTPGPSPSPSSSAILESMTVKDGSWE